MIFLMLPAFSLLIIVYGAPMVHYLWMSFHANSILTGMVPELNGAANWIRLVSDERFWQDAMQTARFAIVSVCVEFILALATAMLLDQVWRGRGTVRAISLIPWALPTTVMALGWRWIFNSPYGPINQLSDLIGIASLNMLANPSISWIATVIGDVWKTTPFMALILLAGLQSIPEDLYEAFKLEGGGSWMCLRDVTLPLLQPYIAIAFVFRFAQAFGVFDLIQVMTGGGPAGSTESLALYAYLNAMRFLDFGYSATLIFASFALLTLLCILVWMIAGHRSNFNQTPSQS